MEAKWWHSLPSPYSKWSPRTSGRGITQESATDAESQAPPQTWTWTKCCASSSATHWSLLLWEGLNLPWCQGLWRGPAGGFQAEHRPSLLLQVTPSPRTQILPTSSACTRLPSCTHTHTPAHFLQPRLAHPSLVSPARKVFSSETQAFLS